MKKILAVGLLALAAITLTGCGNTGPSDTDRAANCVVYTGAHYPNASEQKIVDVCSKLVAKDKHIFETAGKP